uniref:PB1 domain-containing protein n=1 Tax=Globodera rostochiensis TaxID=31243 RepID=A0A914HVW0_GLORO
MKTLYSELYAAMESIHFNQLFCKIIKDEAVVYCDKIAAEKFTFEWLQKVSGANAKTVVTYKDLLGDEVLVTDKDEFSTMREVMEEIGSNGIEFHVTKIAKKKSKEKKIGTENSGKLKTKMTLRTTDSISESTSGRTAESVTPSVVSDTTKAGSSDPPTSPQHSVSNLDQYGDVLEENPQSEFTTHLRRFTKFNLMGNCCEAFNFSWITAKYYGGKLRLIAKGPARNRFNLPIDGHLLIRPNSELQKCVWLSKTNYQGYVFEFDTEVDSKLFYERFSEMIYSM